MASSKGRQRQLARAKWERQQARRATSARRRRIVLVVAAVVVAVGAVGAWLATNLVTGT
ncbi:MAG: hypothetical protein ACOC96_10105 [Actinomycetota bacterium]